MQYTLKDYQDTAVIDVLTELRSASDLYKGKHSRVSSVALTAPTGAGKTVMAAATIEALFFGNDELEMPGDPGAVVLWFSDDPSLNMQSSVRLGQASDLLRNRRVIIEHPFRRRKLSPGNVYFLNTSKLQVNSLLVRGFEDRGSLPGFDTHPDTIPFTIWDTLRETINDPDLTLYMVLDEAHRGMSNRPEGDKPTIVRRLINGQADVPPMPIVWGISATPQRFEKAMEEAQVQDTRIHLRTVDVDVVRVQDSGLLKDDIVLEFPAETGAFNTVLLRRGVGKIKASTKAWADYAVSQGDPDPVVPLLVLQVPNTPNPVDVASALDVIVDEWPALAEGAIAHVFGHHVPQNFGHHSVPYVQPERVQDAGHVRVLLAKDAISTGWDCPRAEVMVSFRSARDRDHITQLLGRMIRTPLARRVEGNDILNSVECILPMFDKKAAGKVLELLLGGDLGSGSEGGRRILIDPEAMLPNAQVPPEVWDAFVEVPTETLPRKHANPIKRLTALAHALAADGLLPGAGGIAHEKLHGVLAGVAAQYEKELAAAEDEVLTVRGQVIRAGTRFGTRADGTFTEVADDRAIRDAYLQGARVLTPDVAKSYLNRLAPSGDEDELLEAFVRVAALGLIPQTRPALDSFATTLTNEWLSTYRVARKKLSDSRQAQYADITAMATEPQLIPMILPKNQLQETATVEDDVRVPFERRARHLLSDADGFYPIGKLNGDEVAVLDREMSRDDALAWYRNPTGGRDALGIAYLDRNGNWRTLRPDFIFFVDGESGVQVNVIDPHGAWLPDALAKLRGMARFAEEYGQRFHRIESVSSIDGKALVLDFTLAPVRNFVQDAIDATDVYKAVGALY